MGGGGARCYQACSFYVVVVDSLWAPLSFFDTVEVIAAVNQQWHIGSGSGGT